MENHENTHQYPMYPFPEGWVSGPREAAFLGDADEAGGINVSNSSIRFFRFFWHYSYNSYLIEKTIRPFCFRKIDNSSDNTSCRYDCAVYASVQQESCSKKMRISGCGHLLLATALIFSALIELTIGRLQTQSMQAHGVQTNDMRIVGHVCEACNRRFTSRLGYDQHRRSRAEVI